MRMISNLSDKVELASNVIQFHPGLVLKDVTINQEGQCFDISVDVLVALPAKYKTANVTFKGVRSVEPVVLAFPSQFPFKAPVIKLRNDFNPNFPHINPAGNDPWVNPCVFFGENTDLINENKGLLEILDQLVEWLHRAARNDLMDREQGWESVRRDVFNGWIEYDVDKINKLSLTFSGRRILATQYFYCNGPEDQVFGRVEDYNFNNLNDKFLNEICSFKQARQNLFGGVTVHFLLSHGASSSKYIFDEYYVENIVSLRRLKDRAASYFFDKELEHSLNKFKMIFNENIIHKVADFSSRYFNCLIFVSFALHRPAPVIGAMSDEKIEILTYAIDLCFRALKKHVSGAIITHEIDEWSKVYFVGAIHAASPSLFRHMSGIATNNVGKVAFIGCGSLGSKVALHFARMGLGPFLLIDNKSLSPHNLARHAAVAASANFFGKAEVLQQHFQMLNADAESLSGNFVDIILSDEQCGSVFDKKIKLFLDTTASPCIRNILSSGLVKNLNGRFASACILFDGVVSILLIDGPEHNPNINDLYVKFYDSLIELEAKNFNIGTVSHVLRNHQGVGCGSLTMVASDVDISAHAVFIAKALQQFVSQGMPAEGKALFFVNKELTMASNCLDLQPVFSIANEDDDWEIRIFGECISEMRTEMENYGDIETGGILFGHISIPTKVLTVSRLIPAPPDSKRSRTEFELGTENLKETLTHYHTKSGKTLTYLGIWHSHPMGGSHSGTDLSTFDRFKKLRFGTPSISLVITPSHFHHKVSES